MIRKRSKTSDSRDFNLEIPQGIELRDMSEPSERAGTSFESSIEVASCSEYGAAREPWNILQIVSAMPTINEVSMRFSDTASYLSSGFSKFIEEADNHDVNSNSSNSAGPSHGANCSTLSSIDVDETSTPSTSSSSTSVLSLSDMSNFSRETANSIISSTGLAMTELGQNFLSFSPTIWQGLVTRIQTTLRGSGDDIGWLQQMPGLAPVEDRTDRFVQLLGSVCNGVHKLPNHLVYLLVPGLFSNHGPLYFVDTKKHFSKLGLTCHIAKIHSEAAVETNAWELKNYIEELYWGSGKQVVLLGHSKGGVDASAAIAIYWSTLKDKVAGLVLVQSPYGGSPIASDILREGQIADLQTRQVIDLLMRKMIKGDIRSLEDLTYDKRRKFLARYPLPYDLPTVSFHTEVSIAPSVISTMSHIAHAELPWSVPNPGTASEELTGAAKIPVIIPLPAAMAICAKHLELRYKQKSDGLVVRKDAEVPGSVVVRPDRKLDHAWMVYSPARKEASTEPDSSQMCEALLTLLLEVSQKSSQVSPCSGNGVQGSQKKCL